MTTKAKSSAGHGRALRMAGALTGLAVVLGACKHVEEVSPMAFAPDDYKQRHPIAVTEIDRSIVVFVGNNRGGLSAAQRADVMALAQTWMREGTGAISIDVPVGTPNARAAADSLREIQAMFAGGRPAAARRQRPPVQAGRSAPHGGDPAELSEDRGGRRSLRPVARGHRRRLQEQELLRQQAVLQFRLRLRSATSRTMIDNPADLVQPRPETPAYTARRTVAFDKYRKGTTTTTTYPEADKAKLSDVGK